MTSTIISLEKFECIIIDNFKNNVIKKFFFTLKSV